jgi:hypothetical protein
MARSNVENKGTKRPTVFYVSTVQGADEIVKLDANETARIVWIWIESAGAIWTTRNSKLCRIAQGTRRPSHEKKNQRPTRQDDVVLCVIQCPEQAHYSILLSECNQSFLVSSVFDLNHLTSVPSGASWTEVENAVEDWRGSQISSCPWLTLTTNHFLFPDRIDLQLNSTLVSPPLI